MKIKLLFSRTKRASFKVLSSLVNETSSCITCRYGLAESVSQLLKRKVDPNCTTRDGRSALDFADSPEIIRELLRHGATLNSKLWKKLLPSKCPKNPAKPAVKTFVVGDPGAGKSTLTKALQTESKWLFSITNRKVAGVNERTAGVIPHEMDSKEFGRLTLYDFAGQKEFYASHDAVLRSAVSESPSAIFLIVADLRNSDDSFKERIQYWLAFIENQGISADPKPHVIIIASHSDEVKVEEEDTKRRIIECLHHEKGFSSFHYVGFVALNCQYARSSSMSQLRNHLARSCKEFRKADEMSFRSHCFLVFLLDKFQDCPAVQIGKVSETVASESESDPNSIASCIPKENSEILQVCSELNQRGNILFLKDAQGSENSWIILERESLLSRVTGTVFAPENFKQHCDIATSTGVVPFSKIQTHFPDLDPDMITQFLCHLEFCRLLTTSEILDVDSAAADAEIHQLLHTESAVSPPGPTEKFFFFPGLVRIEAPSGVWDNSSKFNYHCGWALHCHNPRQFFTPRFVQVLLLRLAFSLALVQAPGFPALQRKCKVWKNGICWGNQSGVEVLVEVEDNKSVVAMLRCLKGSEDEYACVHSQVINKIQQIREEFCPKVTVSEYVLHHSDSKEYPPKPFSELKLVTVEEITSVVGKRNPCVVDEAANMIKLSEYLGFEPYIPPGDIILKLLFGCQPPAVTCSRSVAVSGNPTLPNLLKFTRADKKNISIPVEIGNKYIQFGTLILEDESGTSIYSMEHKHRDAERINMEILCEWLKGKGKQPVTWATLIEVLHDIELTTLADTVRAMQCPTTEQ